MTEQEATGRFDVSMTPETGPQVAIGRMALAKQFFGGLEARSAGTMLALRTATEGSAGYVAIETVTGRLGGRDGAFALQHSGTMERGTPRLVISVVPDSGEGALTGLTGSMTIDQTGGDHRYTLRYCLPG